jgi:hypothetical protein
MTGALLIYEEFVRDSDAPPEPVKLHADSQRLATMLYAFVPRLSTLKTLELRVNVIVHDGRLALGAFLVPRRQMMLFGAGGGGRQSGRDPTAALRADLASIRASLEQTQDDVDGISEAARGARQEILARVSRDKRALLNQLCARDSWQLTLRLGVDSVSLHLPEFGLCVTDAESTTVTAVVASVSRSLATLVELRPIAEPSRGAQDLAGVRRLALRPSAGTFTDDQRHALAESFATCKRMEFGVRLARSVIDARVVEAILVRT